MVAVKVCDLRVRGFGSFPFKLCHFSVIVSVDIRVRGLGSFPLNFMLSVIVRCAI